MSFLRKFIPVLLIVTALSAVVVGPAAAAPPLPLKLSLGCDSGVCKLVADPSDAPELLRNGAGAALKLLPSGREDGSAALPAFEINKDVTLTLPVGDLKLSNASLQVEVGEDGAVERLHGTADMPFPTFGLLDDVRVLAPARAEVGLDLGKNLQGTGLTLDPNRKYLFFNADTAFDVTARTPGKGEPFSLSLAPGQRATLVIDTVEPTAYLNGHVTLSNTDQVTLLGGLLENTTVGPYVPDTLPLRERSQFGLSGKFSKNVAESTITLSGAYTIDGGFLPIRLGIEAQPLRLEGALTLSRDGLQIDGVVTSAIEPDKVFDGGARIEAFVPFREGVGSAYARIDTSVKSPALKAAVEAGAQVGEGEYELSGRLTAPVTGKELSGEISGNLPDVAGAVGKAGGAVGEAVGNAGEVVSNAAGAVGPAVGKAGGAVGEAVGNAAGTVGPAVGKAAGFIGPVVGKAAGTVGGYAKYGFGLAGSAINAGKARLTGPDEQPAAQ